MHLLMPSRRVARSSAHLTARRPLAGVVALGAIGAAGLVAPPAMAEDSLQILPIDETLPETTFFVDILDAGTERIDYTGDQDIDVYRPDGSFLGTFPSGSSINPDQNGAYRFELYRISTGWSLEVPGRSGGRVWSDNWRFDAGSFLPIDGFTGSFYVLTGAGDSLTDAVVELKFEGLAGYVFRLDASDAGLNLFNGRSTVDTGQRYRGTYRVYLEPPEVARLNPLARIQPVVDELTSSIDAGTCEDIVPGVIDTVISWTSTVEGNYHFVCDLNGDGVFDLSSSEDFQRTGRVVIGENSFTWQGRDRDGLPIPPGTYECQIFLTVGEVHYVAQDVETIFPGLRVFEYQSPTDRRPLRMYWDDSLVQANDVLMANDQPSLQSSGPDGIDSGPYDAPTQPGVNARAWGRFRKNSKGNEAWMDTYSWVERSASLTLELSFLSNSGDSDGDGLLDIEESCIWGTDPFNPDTDGDGLDDFFEAIQSPSDPLNPDTDGDCLPDGEEVNADGTFPNTDGDSLPDVIDPDDDNDGIPTCEELRDGPENDLDQDGRPNHQDRDSDGDLFSDQIEGTGDRDVDGRPDFLDPDTIGIGETFGQGYYAGGCNTGGSAPLGWLGLFGGLALVRRRRS